MDTTAGLPVFVLWKWTQAGFRTNYLADHVNLAAWMLCKHGIPFDRIVCVTDDPEGIVTRTFPLWSDHAALLNISGKQLPSCYRRLKIFDTPTLKSMGILEGERVVSFDLDVVILQNFMSLFDRTESFIGWKVPGTKHRIVLNGSMFMFTAGEFDWLWHGFDPDKSPQRAALAGYMGSDQAYLSHQLVSLRSTGGWFPQEHGVCSYMRDVVRLRVLARHTRLVFFPGRAKPWDPAVQKVASWITRYYPAQGELQAWVSSLAKSKVPEPCYT